MHFGDKFGESLGGSRAPPSFPRSSPNFPGSFPATSPEVLSLWNLTAIQRFPGSSPNFPGSSPNFPGSSPDFPGGQPLCLGSLTPSLRRSYRAVPARPTPLGWTPSEPLPPDLIWTRFGPDWDPILIRNSGAKRVKIRSKSGPEEGVRRGSPSRDKRCFLNGVFQSGVFSGQSG